MSGRQAVSELVAAARREELVAAALVARALGLSTRRVLRDWRRRQLPETHVGRERLLPAALAVQTYFRHRADQAG